MPSRGRSATAPTPDLTSLALAILLIGALPLRAMAAPATFAIEPAGSELRFYATSRLMNAEGRFHRFSGRVSLDRDDLASARVTFSVETASIDTANRLRDDHLRSEDFFAAARFPTATFESDRVERAAAGVTVIGRLTVRGVARPVAIPVQVEVVDQALRARGEFEIQRTTFGIAYQSRLNPIGDIVRVVFTFAGRPVPAGGALPPRKDGAATTSATSYLRRSTAQYLPENMSNRTLSNRGVMLTLTGPGETRIVRGQTSRPDRTQRPGGRHVSPDL